MNTLLNDVHQRAIFAGTCSALVLRMAMLETKILIALATPPNPHQLRKLAEADAQLGAATYALQEAARLIGELP